MNILKKCRTALLCCLCSLQLSVFGFSQSVNIEAKNQTLLEVMKNIRTQTGYVFFINGKNIANLKVNASIKNKSVEEAIQLLLKDMPVQWELEEKTILIRPKEEKKKENPTAAPTSIVSYQAQERILRGAVLDVEGNPLEGVSVRVKNTNVGVATNRTGQFELGVPAGKQMLVFTFLGFSTLEAEVTADKISKSAGEGRIQIDNMGQLQVRLQATTSAIENVVVTGYTTVKRESFTGAATNFTGDALMKANPVNLLTALSILDPSFKMVENIEVGSDPNALPDFVVRGEASLPDLDFESEFRGRPNLPIFILDGFETSVEKIYDLDPNIVASITILKDAASTAMYGSRASNGVVVIELKRPAAGAINIVYNLDVSYSFPDLRDYQLLDATQKLELEAAAGFYSSSNDAATDENRKMEYNEKLKLIQQGNNTYWLNKPLRNAVGPKHSLSVQGSVNSLHYTLNVQHEQAPGVMIGSARNRNALGSMLQYRVKNVTFRNHLNYTRVKSDDSPYGTFNQYARINPYFRIHNDQGEYIKNFSTGSWFLNIANPLYNIDLNTIAERVYSEVTNNFGLDWSIKPFLKLQADISFTDRAENAANFKPGDHTDFLNYSIPNYHLRGSYNSQENDQFSYDGKIQLNFFNSYGRHVINSVLATNVQESKGDSYSVLVQGFPSDDLDFLTLGLRYPENSRPTGSDNISRLIGVVNSNNYSFDERFLADFSFRADASSRFGSDRRWAPFWSVGTGWNIHNEAALRKWDVINRFRVRASYGKTGSQNFNPYQSMTTYEYYLTDIYNYMVGAVMKGMGNPNLQWQQTTQFNLGLDLTLFNKLDIIANIYRRNSKNLLTDVTLPPSLGFATFKDNLGEMRNKGFDLSVKWQVFRRSGNYLNLNANLVRNVNTIEKISNSLQTWNANQDALLSNKPKVRYIEGESINTIWGLHSLGINPANGKEIFLTPDGRRVDYWDPSFQQPIGVQDPQFEGTFGANAGARNFTLDLYFRYRQGGQMYNSTLVERVENVDKRFNTDVRVLEERWSKPGDITRFKNVADNTTTRSTSRFVEDYSFIQLASLTLSYNFPQKSLEKWRMKNLRASFSASDLFRTSTVKMERGLVYPFAGAYRTSLRVTF